MLMPLTTVAMYLSLCTATKLLTAAMLQQQDFFCSSNACGTNVHGNSTQEQQL